MPGILIVSATRMEVEPLMKQYGIVANKKEGFYAAPNHPIAVLITGVGMVNTAYYLGTYSQHSFDYFLNMGIAGAFNRNCKLGEVVLVKEDTFSEMGAENGNEFIPYGEMSLGGTNRYVDKSEINSALLSSLRKVKAITVNTVHGNEATINKVMDLFHPDIESMEGAAFFRAFVDLQANVFQIRAVSNYVEKRDTDKWNIPLAVKNLNDFAIAFVNELNL